MAEDFAEDALDGKRIECAAKDMAETIKEYYNAVKSGDDAQKTFIKNAMDTHTEWHNNGRFNDGRSALDVYLKDKCRTQDNQVATVVKTSGRGEFDNGVFATVKETIKQTTGEASPAPQATKGWWQKLGKTGRFGVIAVALAAIGFAAYKFAPAIKAHLQAPQKKKFSKVA